MKLDVNVARFLFFFGGARQSAYIALRRALCQLTGYTDTTLDWVLSYVAEKKQQLHGSNLITFNRQCGRLGYRCFPPFASGKDANNLTGHDRIERGKAALKRKTRCGAGGGGDAAESTRSHPNQAAKSLKSRLDFGCRLAMRKCRLPSAVPRTPPHQPRKQDKQPFCTDPE